VPAGTCLLVGIPTPAGNELGNVVTRRDPVTGPLTIYTIFETPDSQTDNANQGSPAPQTSTACTRRWGR
jgi:hypothetical protein